MIINSNILGTDKPNAKTYDITIPERVQLDTSNGYTLVSEDNDIAQVYANSSKSVSIWMHLKSLSEEPTFEYHDCFEIMMSDALRPQIFQTGIKRSYGIYRSSSSYTNYTLSNLGTREQTPQTTYAQIYIRSNGDIKAYGTFTIPPGEYSLIVAW